jgi:hypothetical protein
VRGGGDRRDRLANQSPPIDAARVSKCQMTNAECRMPNAETRIGPLPFGICHLSFFH